MEKVILEKTIWQVIIVEVDCLEAIIQIAVAQTPPVSRNLISELGI